MTIIPGQQHRPLATELPYWHNYRELMQALQLDSVEAQNPPDTASLNTLLADRIRQQTGKPLRFVPAANLPAVDYEQHIYEQGEISTRQDSWHDLFNALVWARYPLTKFVMNALHCTEIQAGNTANRGLVRDALTLFDECGVIVVSDQDAPLQAMARRDWRSLFCEQRSAWQQQIRIFVLGHALLEKFLQPYKSITAQVLIFQADSDFLQADDAVQRQVLDGMLAAQLQAGLRLRSSVELSPLPLMGIPGWWPAAQQEQVSLGTEQEAGLCHDDFYADLQVFRPPAAGFTPATIHRMEFNL